MRCTKCGMEEALSKFIVDRDTGYCENCAELLRLGTSREAQKMEQGIPRSSIQEEDKDDKEKQKDDGETI